MQLEDYFEFDDCDRIRVRGSRIGIDVIIRHHLQGDAPEWIAYNYPTLSLEEIHATIAYYLHRKSELDAYLKRQKDRAEEQYKEHLRKEPSEAVKRMRAMAAERPGAAAAGS